MGHTWRKQMSQFDGTKEIKPAPKRPTGEDVVKELEELRPITHGQSSTDTSQLSIFSIPGKPFGKADVKELSIQQHEVATFYVLQNCDESQPFIQEHKNILLDAGITNVEEIHKLEFVNWFNQRIIQLYNEGQVDKKMVSLARGPERRAIYYSGYNINGFRFHTIFRDEIRKTQNNGVVVRGENQTDVPYYGRIKDIVELCYTEGNKIVLFDCEWYDTTQEGRGYKRDRYGIITVNIARKLNTQETFVLACQAIQVFYTRGLKDITWSAVTEIKPRNLYEMPVDGGPYQEEIQSISTSYENEDD
ncbi:hypothetical protein JRO89_XS04G0036500 [Xanthoceras sorbifolium]|uniref:DUF4216 domain-containing protein n=1 Tax=Xanthoceras sorbifolium TaxID=99658 RepID=A0ABQ8I4U7_9ROSI|nr:hypothetical protein JRO89_XS04G0036500 [Xanthoceras sorbifolium]